MTSNPLVLVVVDGWTGLIPRRQEINNELATPGTVPSWPSAVGYQRSALNPEIETFAFWLGSRELG
jgi:hypothetical protein